MKSFCLVLQSPKRTESRKTVKLTLTSSTRPKPHLVSRYANIQSVETTQTARISLQCIINVKERRDKNQTRCALTSGAPRPIIPLILAASLPEQPALSPPSRPFRAPPCASAPPVRGYLRIPDKGRKGFFALPRKKFEKRHKSLKVCVFFRRILRAQEIVAVRRRPLGRRLAGYPRPVCGQHRG